MSTSAPHRPLHLVISSHWDREWRHSWATQALDLVRMFDDVVDGLLDGDLITPFATDGQTSILEDYLALRPERHDAVLGLVREGKLEVGPWFTLPDEFLVSGEGLIRNLLLGREIVRQWGGEPSAAGYVPDMFGHNSQLPQIFRSAGIVAAFLWRGVNCEGVRNIRWTGADGSSIPVHRFGAHGYGSYAVSARRGYDYTSAAPDRAYVEAFIEAECDATAVAPVLLLDTCDYQHWDRPAYEVLLDCLRGSERFDVVHSTLTAYAHAMAERFEPQMSLEGELREPGRAILPEDRMGLDGDEQWVIPGVASSRVYLKQGLADAEAHLLRWAEPLAAIATVLCGVPYPPGVLALAWRRLIENHGHDSIGGCSVDRVHRDMVVRNETARDLAERVADDAATALAASIAGDIGPRELRLVAFNSGLRPVREVREIEIPIPDGWPTYAEFFGYERLPAFRLLEDGEERDHQLIAWSPPRKRERERPTRLPEVLERRVATVAVELALPALGYTSLSVRPAERDGVPVRHPGRDRIAVSPTVLQNEHLRVEVDRDGTFAVHDLRTQAAYPGLNAFEDDGDIGDGWYHCSPLADVVVSSSGGGAVVERVVDGPLLGRLRVRKLLSVPAAADRGRGVRDGRRTDLEIETLITLRKGARSVHCRTTVVNHARDHRLRVIFPTGTSVATYLVDSPFDVIEQAVALPGDDHLHRELAVETRPQESWTAVFDGARGLAVIAPGLRETAVLDREGRPIALTLLRAVERTLLVNDEPDGQMAGRSLDYEYELLPLDGPPDVTALTEVAHRLAAGPKHVCIDAQDAAVAGAGGDLAPRRSFARLEGDVWLSSLRAVGGDEIELRVANTTDRAQSARLHLDLPASSGMRVRRTTVEGVALDDELELELDEGEALELALDPKEFRTYRIAGVRAGRRN